MQFKYEGYSLKPGIYRITNTTNGRIYIGQAKEFKARWKQHAASLRNNKHQNKFLQNDFNSCKKELGHDDFLVFEVLEVMEGSTKEQRNAREEVLIQEVWDKCVKCYNIKKEVVGKERSCYSHTPEQTSQKISAAHKELWSNEQWREESLKKLHEGKLKALQDQEFREQLGNKISSTKSTTEARIKTSQEVKERWADPEYRQRVGKAISAGTNTETGAENRRKSFEKRKADQEGWSEYQQKVSAHAKKLWETGVLRREFSDETRRLMSEKARERVAAGKLEHLKTHSFKPKEYQVIDPDGNVITIQNLKRFCEEHGLSYAALRRLACGGRKTYAGYTSLCYQEKRQARKSNQTTPNGYLELLKATVQEL